MGFAKISLRKHIVFLSRSEDRDNRGRYSDPELYETESAKSDIGSIGELRRMSLEQGHVKTPEPKVWNCLRQ